MRTLLIRSLSLPALAFLVLSGNAVAQDKSSALLNTLEVEQLVKRAEPADSARLAAHFTALAERYTAEAKRHTTMSQSFVGNPSRNLATNMSVHCKRLAELNTQSATTLRELATYHQKLASGAAATLPPAGAPFQGGARGGGPPARAGPLPPETGVWCRSDPATGWRSIPRGRRGSGADRAGAQCPGGQSEH